LCSVSILEYRVPVTAKLSRKFYEQLGDDVAGELVDWFNAVDATYQAQLKETNELLWERFKATLQGEAAAIRGEIAALRAEMHGEMGTMHGEIGALRAEMHGEMGTMRGEMGTMRAQIGRDMSAMRGNLLTWMFIYWCGSVIALVALKFSP
jgi:hypothetical protein